MAFVMFNGILEGDNFLGIKDMVIVEGSDKPKRINLRDVGHVVGDCFIIRDSWLSLEDFALLVKGDDLNILTSEKMFKGNLKTNVVSDIVNGKVGELKKPPQYASPRPPFIPGSRFNINIEEED